MIELTIDVTELPTLEDLHRFKVESMRVRVHGPAGGNPCITLRFPNREFTVAFMAEWYGTSIEESCAEIKET